MRIEVEEERRKGEGTKKRLRYFIDSSSESM